MLQAVVASKFDQNILESSVILQFFRTEAGEPIQVTEIPEHLIHIAVVNRVIYTRLRDKESTMLKAVDSDMLEQMPTTDEELDMIFAALNL